MTSFGEINPWYWFHWGRLSYCGHRFSLHRNKATKRHDMPVFRTIGYIRKGNWHICMACRNKPNKTNVIYHHPEIIHISFIMFLPVYWPIMELGKDYNKNCSEIHINENEGKELFLVQNSTSDFQFGFFCISST